MNAMKENIQAPCINRLIDNHREEIGGDIYILELPGEPAIEVIYTNNGDRIIFKETRYCESGETRWLNLTEQAETRAKINASI